jgi:hypothetical protein
MVLDLEDSSRDRLQRRVVAAHVKFVLLLLQARFILPYLTMCLKNRSSLVEMRILWVCVGPDGCV